MSASNDEVYFEEMLNRFGSLPVDQNACDDYGVIEIQLHQGCRFTRQCKLRTSRWWPFGILGTDVVEASRIKSVETLVGETADMFLRELVKTKSILKTFPKTMFSLEEDMPERGEIEGYINDSRAYDERFDMPEHYGFDKDISEEELFEQIYEFDHSEYFDPVYFMDHELSDDMVTWTPKSGYEADPYTHYQYLDSYVDLLGEKIRPEDRKIYKKAVKGHMVINGPTFYVDQFNGGDIGSPYIGKILVGDRVLTEKQLIDLAERYVAENTWNSY